MKFMGLAASLLILASTVQPAYTVTELKSPESEDYLWEILIEESPSDYVAAGILAYFWRESYYRSDAMTNWQYYQEDPCKEFTDQLDAADREEFVALIHRAGGYGLGQWYAESHLESLYDFCKGYGTSFADAEMQCKFTVHMCINNPDVWETLKDASNAREAGKIIAFLHDGSTSGAETIASKAALIYKERVIKNGHKTSGGDVSLRHDESSGTDADHAQTQTAVSETGGADYGRTYSRTSSGYLPGKQHTDRGNASQQK